MLAFLRVLFLMLALAPSRGDADLLFRSQLASTITLATDDAREQGVLARIAWLESSYRKSVASCRVKGDGGKSLGTFQVQPMTEADRALACGPLPGQVDVALRYVRRSLETCAHLEPRDRLSLYTTGRCLAQQREARARWGEP